jgi:predicted RNA-binding Zn-ribbon protein involved in translation (DUF1610 family)
MKGAGVTVRDLRSRVAYLQGLAAGLELDTNSREGRMISEMLSVFQDLAESFTGLAAEQEDLETYVDVLDTDLQELEDQVFGDEDNGVVTEWVSGDAEDDAGQAAALGSGSRIADCYVCPTCGEHVAGREDEAAAVGGALHGSIVLRLVCPRCGNAFCATEPGLVTYIEPEDELTDLPYPTKE